MCKYHSSVTLTPLGNFLVAGSKPNDNFNSTVDKFASELRVVTLDPPFMFVERPKILDTPARLAFNKRISAVSIPASLSARNLKLRGMFRAARASWLGSLTPPAVALMDLGPPTHAFHSSARLVFMDASLSPKRKSLTSVAPPNGRV